VRVHVQDSLSVDHVVLLLRVAPLRALSLAQRAFGPAGECVLSPLC